MFKNALLYRIDHWPAPTLDTLDQRLRAARFVECGASQSESAGWVEPRGQAHGAMAENVAGQIVLRLAVETKAVPGAVVKGEVGRRLDAIEKDTGRRPRGHARRPHRPRRPRPRQLRPARRLQDRPHY